MKAVKKQNLVQRELDDLTHADHTVEIIGLVVLVSLTVAASFMHFQAPQAVLTVPVAYATLKKRKS